LFPEIGNGDISKRICNAQIEEGLYLPIVSYMMGEGFRKYEEYRRRYYRDRTTILVTKETKERLDKLKLHPREPYEGVIRRLLGGAKG
jgi:hypothetical protein